MRRAVADHPLRDQAKSVLQGVGDGGKLTNIAKQLLASQLREVYVDDT